MKTFYEWLKEQKGRDEPIGDLAGDVMRMLGSEHIRNDIYAWADHVGTGVLETLLKAWEEYEINNVKIISTTSHWIERLDRPLIYGLGNDSKMYYWHKGKWEHYYA